MDKEQLEMIYEMIKDKYGDCTSVTIFVNCEGLTISTSGRVKLEKDRSMRTINGNWVSKQ